MYSPSCPSCGGSGLVAVHFWAVKCALCEANLIGNAHLTPKDLKNQSYMESWAKAERDPQYWQWLAGMVFVGAIGGFDKPKPKKPKRKRSAKKKVT
jgi:hypothetical protein